MHKRKTYLRKQLRVLAFKLDGLDEHRIAGILVGLQLLAVPVKQNALGPQDQHYVVGVRP